jgi:predicted dehydrogenase
MPRRLVAAVREEQRPQRRLLQLSGAYPPSPLAKKMIAEGRWRDPPFSRGTYLQDWIVYPNLPLGVALAGPDIAGSGSHGDPERPPDRHRLTSLIGPIAEVCGMLDTLASQRPVLAEIRRPGVGRQRRAARRASDAWTDSSIFIARFASGAVGTFEATRMAAGRKNYNRWEINGSKARSSSTWSA